MTIWNLLLIVSTICSTLWFICAWSYFFSTLYAKGTKGRATWGWPLAELRPILREITAIYIVTNWIWQMHDGSFNGWDILGYLCYIFTTWVVYKGSDDDDRWGKRFRRWSAALHRGRAQPETA